MIVNSSIEHQCTTDRSRSLLRRWKRNEDGATAIEFAILAIPFLGLMFAIIGAGIYFFTVFSAEHAVEQASRQIRTGTFKAANANAGMTTLEFKNLVCSFAPAYLDCASKVRVFVTVIPDENAGNAAATGFSGASTRPACLSNNQNLVAENSNAASRVTAGASQIVQVAACFQFDLAYNMPFLQMGKAPNTNTSIIQATAVFRTEPFE